jgi:hypothetical protein
VAFRGRLNATLSCHLLHDLPQFFKDEGFIQLADRETDLDPDIRVKDSLREVALFS